MNDETKLEQKKKDVKIYVPKKEQVQRIQQQVMIMNRAIIGA